MVLGPVVKKPLRPSQLELRPTVVAMPDASGDGRPELAVREGGGVVVVASGDLRRGETLAVPALAFGGTSDPGTDDGGTPAIISGGEIVTAQLKLDTSPFVGSTVLPVATHDAAGRPVVPDVSVTVPGYGALVDHDPATGDNLFETFDLLCALRNGDKSSASCDETVLRARPDGTVESQFALPIGKVDVNPSRPVFGPDGPDADASRDVYLLHSDGVNSPTATILQLASATTGTVPLSSLPALAVGGVPIHAELDALETELSGSPSFDIASYGAGDHETLLAGPDRGPSALILITPQH